MKKKFPGRSRGSRSKKLSHPEFAERVRRLRNELKLSQEKFAELLGVKQSAVSAWEQGKPAPAAENYVRLGNVALASEDTLWFWQQAGMNIWVFERAAEEQLKGRSMRGELIEIRPLEEGETENLALPVSRIPNRLTTRYLRVPNEFVAGEFLPFRPGDILVIDRSETDLRKFDNWSLIALDVTQGKMRNENAPPGLSIGWLEKQDATIGPTPVFHFMLKVPSLGGIFIGSSTGSGLLDPIRDHLVLGRVVAWIAAPGSREQEKKK